MATPTDPKLNDAKRLFDWVLRADAENNDLIALRHGPRVMIIGRAPEPLLEFRDSQRSEE